MQAAYAAILRTFKVICPATRANPQSPTFFEFFVGRKRMKIYNFSTLYQLTIVDSDTATVIKHNNPRLNKIFKPFFNARFNTLNNKQSNKFQQFLQFLS